MKLENQVVSLELAKKLKKLGFEQESSQFVWVADSNTKEYKIVGNSSGEFWRWRTNFMACGRDDEDYGWYSAYTVAELGEMLKGYEAHTEYHNTWKKWYCFWNDGFNKQQVEALTEADARAKMLIYLKENNLIN